MRPAKLHTEAERLVIFIWALEGIQNDVSLPHII
jgi:hypothetical protein